MVLVSVWPTMIKDVVDYCRRCGMCQKRAPITFRDRVPIEDGVVSVEPVFSHMLMLLDLYLIIRSNIITALYFLIVPQDFLML